MDETVAEMNERLAREEIKKQLPNLDRLAMQYIALDQPTLKKLICVKEDFFRRFFAKRPELKIIEHRAPQEDGRGGRKVYYLPDEATAAVRKIIKSWN